MLWIEFSIVNLLDQICDDNVHFCVSGGWMRAHSQCLCDSLFVCNAADEEWLFHQSAHAFLWFIIILIIIHNYYSNSELTTLQSVLLTNL